MHRIFLLLFIAGAASAQRKFEIREVTGIVKGFESGMGFAYERLIIDNAGAEEAYHFSPFHGTLVMGFVKKEDNVTLRIRSYPPSPKLTPEQLKNFKRMWNVDEILAIKNVDRWLELDEVVPPPRTRQTGMFFDIVIKDILQIDKFRKSLIFDGGIVGYRWSPYRKEFSKGDVVSFIGYAFPVDDRLQYPVPHVKQVYYFSELLKADGRIKSLLFKQNHVCIGMVVRTTKGEIRVSFPSNYGKQIERFATNDQPVTIYYGDYQPPGQLTPPELHAVIHGRDTLKIMEYGFYGGADIRHEHTSASIEGKITQVRRLENGSIINIIVGNDCYVEIDHTVQKQLKNYFRRGQVIAVEGAERIKHDGELYEKNYRIITPRKFVIDGKTFLLNQLP